MTEKHEILVGNKPFMNYVTAVVMQFTTKNAGTVIIKSRGKFISKAVDIAEVVKSRFLIGQVAVSNIVIDSEEFKNREGRTVRVSTIEVSLSAIKNSIISESRKKTKPEPEPEPEIEFAVEGEPETASVEGIEEESIPAV